MPGTLDEVVASVAGRTALLLYQLFACSDFRGKALSLTILLVSLVVGAFSILAGLRAFPTRLLTVILAAFTVSPG